MAFYHWRNFPEKNPVLLWDETPGWMDGVDQDPPSLTPYLAENAKSAIVVCPGGGYAMKASHEAEDIAQMYQAQLPCGSFPSSLAPSGCAPCHQLCPCQRL